MLVNKLRGYFSGSHPPLLQGLHRIMRQAAFNPPRTTPYFSIAAIAYSEQVGE